MLPARSEGAAYEGGSSKLAVRGRRDRGAAAPPAAPAIVCPLAGDEAIALADGAAKPASTYQSMIYIMDATVALEPGLHDALKPQHGLLAYQHVSLIIYGISSLDIEGFPCMYIDFIIHR